MPCSFQKKDESSGESMEEHIESTSKTLSLTAGAKCFSGTVSKTWNNSTTNKTTKAFRDVTDYIERARFEMPNVDFNRIKLREFVVD